MGLNGALNVAHFVVSSLMHVKKYMNVAQPGGNLQFRQMKPMQKCLKPAFLLLTSRGIYFFNCPNIAKRLVSLRI